MTTLGVIRFVRNGTLASTGTCGTPLIFDSMKINIPYTLGYIFNAICAYQTVLIGGKFHYLQLFHYHTNQFKTKYH